MPNNLKKELNDVPPKAQEGVKEEENVIHFNNDSPPPEKSPFFEGNVDLSKELHVPKFLKPLVKKAQKNAL